MLRQSARLLGRLAQGGAVAPAEAAAALDARMAAAAAASSSSASTSARSGLIYTGQQPLLSAPHAAASAAAVSAAAAAQPWHGGAGRGGGAAPWNADHLGRGRGLMTYMPSPGDARPHTVTLIPGDGIGPEMTSSVIAVVEALKAPIVWERHDELSGAAADGSPPTVVPPEILESIRRNKVCLKGTLFTPLSKKNTSTQSLNVQLRKDLDLVVNLIHGFSIPGVKGIRHGDELDIVVVRENTEGEYSGLEHEVVDGVVESLKVITEEKSLRTAEYAFEFAFLNNRRRVTAVHKANIMKKGDGMFLKACKSVAARFPTIEYSEMIVDNTCMQLVSKPEQFDVMVTPNLYGNLVANVVAGLCGGAGVCPGGNIGSGVAVFEQGARHVSAALAGKNLANPTALLLSTSMMLRHLQLHNFSDRLEAAVLAVYAAGDDSVLTPDVGGTGTTTRFTDAVVRAIEA